MRREASIPESGAYWKRNPIHQGGTDQTMRIRSGRALVTTMLAGLAIALPLVGGWEVRQAYATPQPAVAATAADTTTYHKWSLIAIAETKRKYPQAALVDYLHIGRTQLENGLSEEKFKLWLRQDHREFGVYVTVKFADAEGRLVSITTRESSS